jgi:hypothetical protein
MTLKNEFLTAHSISGGIGMNEKQAVQCIRIAEDFAMAFTEWRLTTHIKNIYQYTMKELLDIYKQNRNL